MLAIGALSTLAPSLARTSHEQQRALVDNSLELEAALRRARGGETLVLTPGSYSGVTLKGLQFAEPVTLTGSNVKLMDLTVRGSRGLVFDSLTFQVSENGQPNQFQILESESIHFRRITVVGDPERPISGKGGLMLRSSRNLSVEGSTFRGVQHGLTLLDSADVTVTANRFSSLQTDGIRGGGSSNIRIDGNYFTDFFPAPKDHPDAIQLWTTRTTASAQDIQIIDNLVARGRGATVQGVFLRDQLDNLPYTNILIQRNIVLGGLWNGITVDGGVNVEILDNFVAGFPDQISWIRIENILGGNMSGNKAQKYVEVGGVRDFKRRKNASVSAVQNAGEEMVRAWLAAHPNLARE